MRDLATEPKKAYHHLGSESGQAFIGLVADFRVALFAGDVPGSPTLATKDIDSFKLDWFISTGCTLRTVIAAASSGDDAWKSAHRIHLVCINIDGQELI
jgi:hypothetical protein